MLISPTPFTIPVNTANLPTEAVKHESAQKTPIPEPVKSSEQQSSRNSTETGESARNLPSYQKAIAENESNGRSDAEAQEQQKQERRQQERQQSIELQEVEQLKRRDREVRAHEAAHASVGGSFAGAPQLTFKTGPDGKRYAVAGEVAIDISKASTPQATLSKMQQIQRAALAPAEPSGQDRRVAAKASQYANEARVELRQPEQQSETNAVGSAKQSDSAADSEQQGSVETESNGVGATRAEALSSRGSQREREFSFRSEYSGQSLRRSIENLFAQQSSRRLNQKIINSGALDDPFAPARISERA